MQKSAPSAGRILIALGFAVSCFALLLFLWVTFGGPVPLKAKSYRITAYFPEAVQLAVEADVRVGGVSVGKVKAIDLAPVDVRSADGQDMTEAEIEIKPEFAPISSDAQAMLRQKTLLGETYVELTSGTEPGDGGAPISLGAAAHNSDAETEAVEAIPEDGTLGVGQVENQTQIDEIFNALDPQTRSSFQRWQQNAAVAIQGRGLDLNDAFGNLGPFLDDASNVLSLLRRQKAELKGLVRDTGTVFEALTEREDDLRGLIVNSNEAFGALASEEQALADLFQVLPATERESQLTFERLDEFQANTLPLIRDLQPVADDITPTLRSVRELSPNLKALFPDIGDLVRVSKTGLPSLTSFLEELAPVLDSLDPFLANLNPVIDFLEYNKSTVNDFLTSPPVGLSGTLAPEPGQPAARHTLRQLGYITQESLAIYQERLPTNRGNGYIRPFDLLTRERTGAEQAMFPSFDCDNTGEGEVLRDDPKVGVSYAPCWIDKDYPARFGGTRFPQITEDP